MIARTTDSLYGRIIAPLRVASTHSNSRASAQILPTSGMRSLATFKRNCTSSIAASRTPICTSSVLSSPQILMFGDQDCFSGNIIPTRSKIAVIVEGEKLSSMQSSWSRCIRAAITPSILAAEDGMRSQTNCQSAIDQNLAVFGALASALYHSDTFYIASFSDSVEYEPVRSDRL
ncbi:hypothetical protein BSY16_6323 (plasmid) [Sinorhizobium sp. RAC02]|nr:hypothetical protein BSY16_6323 [Sinorhizobium sp. RAC02]